MDYHRYCFDVFVFSLASGYFIREHGMLMGLAQIAIYGAVALLLTGIIWKLKN